jgi:HSP20 family protein
MSRELGKLMQSFLPAMNDEPRGTCWRPPVDVYRGQSAWFVKFDLAGVRQEDIAFSARGRELTVRGCRRDITMVEGNVAYSMEIAYNAFERSVELPFSVDQATIKMDYRDGMLLVEIVPAAPESEASQS